MNSWLESFRLSLLIVGTLALLTFIADGNSFVDRGFRFWIIALFVLCGAGIIKIVRGYK